MAVFVSEISGVLSFVLTLDRDDKLVGEAKVLRTFRSTEKLPEPCRQRFPRIYAIKEDAPPFTYLMESFSPTDGFEGLDDLIFVSAPAGDGTAFAQQAVRRVMASVNALYEGYEASKDPRRTPSIEEDYLERIKFRLNQAGEKRARVSLSYPATESLRPPCPKGGRLHRNRWQPSRGISGRLAVEWVAVCYGIGGRLRLEYAPLPPEAAKLGQELPVE